MDTQIYESILKRRSIRRYTAQAISKEDRAQIEKEITQIAPLHPGNKINILIKNSAKGEDLATLVGGYGKILSPPHYLVPSMTGNVFVLTDLGYCVEKLVLRLTSLGLGTCYVGTVGQEQKVRRHFKLAENARIGALVAFGTPAGGVGGVVNLLIRKSVGAENKLPVDKIFFTDSFANPAFPPHDLAPVIEAARLAPSAVNAQPWRLLRTDETIFLFVAARYPKSKSDYCLFDGGICMANISVALEALGLAGKWHFLTGTEPDLPNYPADLRPLARLEL